MKKIQITAKTKKMFSKLTVPAPRTLSKEEATRLLQFCKDHNFGHLTISQAIQVWDEYCAIVAAP